ncbi:MAG: HD-GYP domain-containing protein [Phycisphaerae bacterium]|nr:HD-GYP domain-containing protein [Phycisphaerae bacterium]
MAVRTMRSGGSGNTGGAAMNRRDAWHLLSSDRDDRAGGHRARRRVVGAAYKSYLRDLKTELPHTTTGDRPASSREIARLHRRLIHAQIDTIMTLVAAVEAKDPYTQQHSVHVPRYAECFAQELHLSTREMEVIKTAALLHDIGKIGVPDAILTKPGPLTTEEFAVVKRHPATGAAILRSATSLRRELPLVLHHHEWYDGSGYPNGLKGSGIPFGARILHAADAIDAMLYPRSYKQGYEIAKVVSELEQGREKQFDPVVADVAIQWLASHPEQLTTDTERAGHCHHRPQSLS